MSKKKNMCRGAQAHPLSMRSIKRARAATAVMAAEEARAEDAFARAFLGRRQAFGCTDESQLHFRGLCAYCGGELWTSGGWAECVSCGGI